METVERIQSIADDVVARGVTGEWLDRLIYELELRIYGPEPERPAFGVEHVAAIRARLSGLLAA
jgi:hypothetical protein